MLWWPGIWEFRERLSELKKDNKKRKERIEAHITEEVEESDEKKSKGIDLHY